MPVNHKHVVFLLFSVLIPVGVVSLGLGRI